MLLNEINFSRIVSVSMKFTYISMLFIAGLAYCALQYKNNNMLKSSISDEKHGVKSKSFYGAFYTEHHDTTGVKITENAEEIAETMLSTTMSFDRFL